jgi:hypothetical protein
MPSTDSAAARKTRPKSALLAPQLIPKEKKKIENRMKGTTLSSSDPILVRLYI